MNWRFRDRGKPIDAWNRGRKSRRGTKRRFWRSFVDFQIWRAIADKHCLHWLSGDHSAGQHCHRRMGRETVRWPPVHSPQRKWLLDMGRTREAQGKSVSTLTRANGAEELSSTLSVSLLWGWLLKPKLTSGANICGAIHGKFQSWSLERAPEWHVFAQDLLKQDRKRRRMFLFLFYTIGTRIAVKCVNWIFLEIRTFYLYFWI